MRPPRHATRVSYGNFVFLLFRYLRFGIIHLDGEVLRLESLRRAGLPVFQQEIKMFQSPLEPVM